MVIARTTLIACTLLAVAPAQGQNLAQLKAQIASGPGVRADFTYTMSSAYWGDDQVLTGHLVLQGSQYRVETNTDVIISHGQDSYTYRPLEKQVLITTGEPAFSPTTLLGDWEKYYDVEGFRSATYKGSHHQVITLSPRDADLSIVEAAIWLRAADNMVTRIRLLDINETTADFVLTNIDLTPQIGPDTFDLSFPEGTEIIDLRS